MTRKEWNDRIQEVFDNLDKEMFDTLLNNCNNKIENLIEADRIKLIPKTNETSVLVFQDDNDKSAFDVFKIVSNSRRLSFKQFKMLSAFSKTDWLNIYEQEVEYKQF